MSLLDKAKIVQAPSGYDTSSLNSVVPSDGDGDFDFTRASNATRTNDSGLIETVSSNVPRINYDVDSNDDVSCGYLLLEPSRTNELTYSEDLDQWTTAGGGSITTGATTSPKGTNDGFKLETDGSNNFGRIEQAVSLSSANNVVFSVFVKKSGSDDVFTLRLEGTGLGGSATNSTYNYTFSTSTLSKVSGGTADSTFVENYGNGWYRIGIELSNTTVTKALFYPSFNSTDLGEVFIWGAQLEEGTFKTTYIETGASTVTRSQDVCKDAGDSSLFSDTEGTLFVEIASLTSSPDDTKEITVNDGTADTRFSIRYVPATSQVFIFARVGGTNIISRNFTLTDSKDFNKIAFKFKSGDSALWVNGSERKTDTNTFTASGLSQIDFRRSGSGGNVFEGKAKQLVYFDEALSDAELTSLTT